MTCFRCGRPERTAEGFTLTIANATGDELHAHQLCRGCLLHLLAPIPRSLRRHLARAAAERSVRSAADEWRTGNDDEAHGWPKS